MLIHVVARLHAPLITHDFNDRANSNKTEARRCRGPLRGPRFPLFVLAVSLCLVFAFLCVFSTYAQAPVTG